MWRASITAVTALVLIGGIDLVTAEQRDPVAARRAQTEVAELRLRYAQQRPQLVLLGDSIVREGVDDALLGRRVELRSLNVANGGAASAWCYLALANLILPADPPPERVVVFYRDHFLTEPRFRVDGPYRERLAALAGEDDPLVQRLAFAPDPSARVGRLLPLYGRRDRLRAQVHGSLIDAVGAGFFGLEPGAAEATLDRVFADRAFDVRRLGQRQLEAERTDPARFEFGRDVDASFLPEMVRLAEQRGVRLLFVRTKRRRDLEPGKEPDGLPRYQTELRSWLAQRGIPLIDFTHDARLRADHYAAGDHLSRDEGRRVFTELLAQALAPELARQERPPTSL